MNQFDTVVNALRPQPAFDVLESAYVMGIQALMASTQRDREFHELNRLIREETNQKLKEMADLVSEATMRRH